MIRTALEACIAPRLGPTSAPRFSITSNLPFDEWTETFGTERLTGALLDRLTHHVHILEMNGQSFRLNHSRACRHPDNVWSLHGYHECLERLGRHAEAAIVRQKLQITMARTDVPVTASCYCRLHTR